METFDLAALGNWLYSWVQLLVPSTDFIITPFGEIIRCAGRTILVDTPRLLHQFYQVWHRF